MKATLQGWILRYGAVNSLIVVWERQAFQWRSVFLGHRKLFPFIHLIDYSDSIDLRSHVSELLCSVL
jgi:hypothetical protein